MINYKTFLYEISELSLSRQTGKCFELGILSLEEDTVSSFKQFLKLISCRLSFAKILEIELNGSNPLYMLLNVGIDYKGMPFIMLSQYFYEKYKFIKINKVLVSFSYQSGYIACGLAYS